MLICVGGTKCATSWLHGYIGSLPGVAASPLKELHFFDRKFPRQALSDIDRLAIRRMTLYLSQDGDPTRRLLTAPAIQAAVDRVQMIYDDDAYFGHFARISTPGTRVFCDTTPAYSVIGAEGFAWMRAFCEAQGLTVKVLFVMRDPVERLWSQLRHMQQMTIIEDAAAAWPRALASALVLARGDYAAIVADLDAHFAAGEVLYLFYETLMRDENLHRLCQFIGVPHRAADTGRRRNETEVRTGLPEEARDAFLETMAPQYAFCQERFATDVPETWQG